MSMLAREALGYALASICALLVDFAILAFLVQTCGWWYVAAATLSFLAGILVVYGLSVRFIFKNRRLADKRAEFLSFAAIGTLGLALNVGVIYLLVRYFAVHYLLAKCAAAGLTFGFNFLARRQLLFVPRAAL
jgi:putative flippase GtrA